CIQSLLCLSCSGKPASGDYRKDPRDRSRSPIERIGASPMSLVGGHLYAHMPSLAMDQPLALTKNMDATRTVAISPTVSPVERQQVTPALKLDRLYVCVILSHYISHSVFLCPSANTACDPVIEEHFRRSLGKNYKEPEPVTNSVSITGSVDDHFTKALGETWLQIKAKGSSSASPDSSTNGHMVNHNHSPSLVS
uniref:Vestigial-like family member 4b n=1 Tax=Sinocyclocheilus grahami TaxID=75366 RepID=A0A672K1E6_SINGR